MIKIVIVTNSTLGQEGNIGFRYYHTLKCISEKGQECLTISRGNLKPIPGIKQVTSIALKNISRALNGTRIYLYRNFNHKRYDNFFFRTFCIFHLRRRKLQDSIVLTTECDPVLIAFLKKKTQKVILDMPIAPQAYLKRILSTFPGLNLQYHQSVDNDERLAIELADEVVCPSEFVANEIKLISPNKKITIVNFGSNLLQETRSNPKNHNGNINFCFAGMISNRKGIDILLDAFSDEIFNNDNLHLCGRVYPEFEQKLKQRKNIIAPGFVNTEKYFQSCDVYVFPSWMEGSSKSIYEAMAAGMPVITTYSSGSIIEDGVDGFIIPPGDSKTLREKMLLFKKKPELIEIMGSRAHKKSLEYTWDAYAYKVYQLLVFEI